MATEYRVEVIQDRGIGALLFGVSSVSRRKINALLNRRAREGWMMDFMLVEQRRYWLFWEREAVLITLRRDVP